MTLAPFAPGIEAPGRTFLSSLTTEHGGIQIQREAVGRALEQQQMLPERTPELLDVRLGEAEEEVADRVISGKAGQAQQRVEHLVGAQPLGVGEAARAHHHGHQEGGDTMGQRDGVVGGGFGEGQMFLDLPGEPDLAEE